MSEKETGGPAFPIPLNPGESYRAEGHGPADGMTLRDWFAGKALDGICAHPDSWGATSVKEVCKRAYEIADLMLEERTK
jgi:hypothetical protein